jgi:DNA-binding NarL/FixJ family response regulator
MGSCVERTRTLLALSEGMLGEIVRELLANAPEIEVIGQLEDQANLQDTVRRLDPDVVVITGADTVALADGLLARESRLRVLAIGGEGQSALLYELRPRRLQLGELSPETLLAALRASRSRTARLDLG